MINTLGKMLVLLNVTLSLLALAFAAALYLEFVDLGWAIPARVPYDPSQQVASQVDRSQAAIATSTALRDVMVARVKPVQQALAEAEAHFPTNHLYYREQIEALRVGDNPIEVKRVKAAGNPTDPAGKAFGKPVFEDKKIDGLEHTRDKYTRDWLAKLEEVKNAHDELKQLVDESETYHQVLTGRMGEGKEKPGLYDLLDAEYEAQQSAKAELAEYLDVSWARTLELARLFTLRRANLEQSRARLQEALDKRKR